jgi:hypothetical protein
MTIDGGEIGYCTGSLVNNTAQDCKNYFLSAQHCSIGSTPAELGQHVFYFNYEAPGCTSPANDDGLAQQTVVGCVKIASSGASTELPPDGSDFQLLELNPIPAAYNVFFGGWNRKPLAEVQGNGAIIQHPQGDLKKISFWDYVEPGFSLSHLYAHCIPSVNGEGIVEPSSSGSPVFDVNHQVVGNVTHGASGCVSGTQFPSAAAGQFFLHWDQNGTGAAFQLKPWLDPANTGVTTLSGKNHCSATPVKETPAHAPTFSLVPNPASRLFRVQSESAVEAVVLFDALGRQVLAVQNKSEVDVSALPSGVYFVKIRLGGGHEATGQIVKE